jgi:hypothetical protein
MNPVSSPSPFGGDLNWTGTNTTSTFPFGDDFGISISDPTPNVGYQPPSPYGGVLPPYGETTIGPGAPDGMGGSESGPFGECDLAIEFCTPTGQSTPHGPENEGGDQWIDSQEDILDIGLLILAPGGPFRRDGFGTVSPFLASSWPRSGWLRLSLFDYALTSAIGSGSRIGSQVESANASSRRHPEFRIVDFRATAPSKERLELASERYAKEMQ